MPDLRRLVALLCLLAPISVSAGPVWVIELGQADRGDTQLADDDCPAQSGGNQRLFDCERPGPLTGDGSTFLTLGMDYPLLETGNGTWQAGFRLGRVAESTLESAWTTAGGEQARFSTVSRTDFALATLAREYDLGHGFGVRIGAGAGVARTSAQESLYERRSNGTLVEARRPPDNESTGYALRGEFGLAYTFGNDWRLGLVWRHDVLDDLATGAGDGLINDGQSESTVTFEHSRGSFSVQSLALTLSLPFGSGSDRGNQ
jgi:hypothetical protein